MSTPRPAGGPETTLPAYGRFLRVTHAGGSPPANSPRIRYLADFGMIMASYTGDSSACLIRPMISYPHRTYAP